MHQIFVDGAAITPSKIICIGRNYVAHAEELGNEIPDEMVVFNKPNSAISDILRSQIDSQILHYEGEIAFTVKAGTLSAVGFGLDLTKRELQSKLKAKGLPWERAKAFDGAAVFSHFTHFTEDVDSLSLELAIDNELRQAGDVGLMIFNPKTIVQELLKFISLEDGDVIMTGTPAGVGAIKTGQQFHGKVLAGSKVLTEAVWVAQ